MREHDQDEPLYSIGVAASLVSSHAQTLRMYERSGLIKPRRTGGNVRLYSDGDIERIRRIQTYTAMGVNLAGIEIIFRLVQRVEELEAQLARETAELRRELEEELTEDLREQLRREENES